MAVVLIMLDGVRPDALDAADCPQLQAFRDQAAATMDARSVMPSITLPCHVSIFHSVPPQRHGITSNDWTPPARPLPGLIEVAAAAQKRCGFFYNWEQLRDLSRPGHLHYSYFRDGAEHDPAADEAVAHMAAEVIGAEKLDFAFVYFGTVDTAGHTFGWMSDGYLNQLERIDRVFGALLAALPAASTILVQSDHGGHERTHGTAMVEDLRIPWMLSGPGVRAGTPIDAAVSLLDSAPTIAHILGLDAPAAWEGRVVREALAP
ncbi:MAG: sulfatase-like hydrolase/transferase [Oscillochloris sp.]|nr:sulfatase-like hydrolase/transferase [Oscillochloris sp.]